MIDRSRLDQAPTMREPSRGTMREPSPDLTPQNDPRICAVSWLYAIASGDEKINDSRAGGDQLMGTVQDRTKKSPPSFFERGARQASENTDEPEHNE